ncbi:MAG TPA: DUF2510 domain-containing protein [Propionicimonas sp.]|uniref:DUF2510 domain-containing protein n=1 Tax=Propionicimonas sp. TaxID=1955623 RepID=UPI002F42E252
MSQAAAGWYRQPDGSHRYWDGQAWTNHITPAAESASLAAQHTARWATGQQSQSAQVPPVRAGKPLFQRVWVWAVVIVVALPVIGSLAARGIADATTGPAAFRSASPGASGTATKKPSGTTSPKTKKAKASKKSPYATLTSRQFKLLAKDPDSYAGKTYVLYGEITQFDAATGRGAFLAHSGPKKLRISHGYTTFAQNSQFSADEIMFGDLVEGDCFTAKVTVLGAYTYDTQAGGNTTVPRFQVDSISVYGSTDG